jgi:hypothetical protein
MKGISTENLAFKLTDSVLKSVDQKTNVGGLFSYLAKAFDCKSNYITLLWHTWNSSKLAQMLPNRK